MSSLQQHLFDLPAPQLPPVAVRVREVATAALPAPAAARELWAAVQLGTQLGADAPPDGSLPQALSLLVTRAQAFTSRVAVEASDVVLLELGGSQRLFGGLPGLLRALRSAFPRPLQLALAPTPLAAVLLARAGRNCCVVSAARLAGRLAPLPLRHLHWPPQEVQRLASMGVNTMAELLRLPRAGVARRIGPERLLQLDRLTGSRSDPRLALRAPERFRARIDPDYETIDRDRLLAALAPSLTQLEEFLRERQRGVMALRLVLHGRRGHFAECLLRCVVPEYRAARFAALLAARLEATAIAGPVRRMELTAGRLRRFIASSGSLWGPGEHGGGAARQAPEFLQTLMARLGEQAVYGLTGVDEHRPERQQLKVWPTLLPGPAQPVPLPGALRPCGLLPEPVPLQIIRDAAGQVRRLLHAGAELTLLSGPERIETGWWDGAEVARDYYIARAADGGEWWIFRDCGRPRRWFLHGCFA
ncbi:MAG: DNA polymerase Y family protein [Steroidobacteraceae bacterium]